MPFFCSFLSPPAWLTSCGAAHNLQTERERYLRMFLIYISASIALLLYWRFAAVYYSRRVSNYALFEINIQIESWRKLQNYELSQYSLKLEPSNRFLLRAHHILAKLL